MGSHEEESKPYGEVMKLVEVDPNVSSETADEIREESVTEENMELSKEGASSNSVVGGSRSQEFENDARPSGSTLNDTGNEVKEQVEALIVTIPRYLHQEPDCMAAKEAELDNWKVFGVYEEVDDIGQPTINTSRVLVRKGGKVKARLCVRGDQESDKEKIKTDSPTVNKVNIKLFYALAMAHGWPVQSDDVKAAFLQGAALDRDVFVRPPKECRVEGRIWKMLKRAYGFVDASRGFYLELDKVLLELGCEAISLDQAMYVYRKHDDSLSGMILTHVNDFLHRSGDKEIYEKIMGQLKKRQKLKKELSLKICKQN